MIFPSEARPNAEPWSNGWPNTRSCDLGAKRSGIGTAKVNKKFWGPRRTTDGQKWHDLIWGFPRIFLFLFLRFFQIFYTKMFVQIFFNDFTLKLFLNFVSMDIHFKVVLKFFFNIFTLKWWTKTFFQRFYTKTFTNNFSTFLH